MNGRNGTLPPISVQPSDWSPLTRYQSLNSSDSPYSPAPPTDRPLVITPPTSGHTSASTTATDGGMPNGVGTRKDANGNDHPSPPSSVARSSDGTGLHSHAPSMVGSVDSRKAYMMEEALSEHYSILKNYLAPDLRGDKNSARQNRARDKLLRLSAVQFQELSTDVYDELLRREDERQRSRSGASGNDTPKYLQPKSNFHYKRNQARQKLSTLPLDRFRQLATDVFYELERRFPRFGGGDIDRIGSPAPSVASSSRGPTPRSNTPNSMGSGPLRYRGPAGRGGPSLRNGLPNGYSAPGSDSARNGPLPNNDYGRPLPKTFQSNTIVPNKSVMVEDDDDQSNMDDDDGQEDLFDLGATTGRQSKRTTGRSLGGQQDRLIAEYRTQVSQLEEKVDSLESKLSEKDREIGRLQADYKNIETTTDTERSEWSTLRKNLERKLEDAQNLNSTLQAELDKLQTQNIETERDLRAQLQDANQRGMDGEWRQRYKNLDKELGEQQQVTEEVRREAAQFLQEMRAISEQNNQALEKEERLAQQVSQLEGELQDWKSRYARTKTQLRTLRASSMGLAMQSPGAGAYAHDAAFTQPDGLVKDVHMTKFQLSIDELLQVARRAESSAVLDCMKAVVLCVRNITSDIDTASAHSSTSSEGLDTVKQQSKLKARVSATANNLITASKNHSAAAGLSPVSLLDAAASHLTTAVVELVRLVKIRPTPADELKDEDYESDARPPPLNLAAGKGGYFGLQNGLAHARHVSRGSGSSAGYSGTSSSRRSVNSGSASPRRPDMWSRSSESMEHRRGLSLGMGTVRESGLEEFKNYLEDQTALLVRSIQPLVHSIHSTASSTGTLANAASTTSSSDEAISTYITDISRAVESISAETSSAISTLHNPALAKHAPPVVEALEQCRRGLEDARAEGARERMPPLAFKIARATKELVLRVERIEEGELGVGMVVGNDF